MLEALISHPPYLIPEKQGPRSGIDPETGAIVRVNDEDEDKPDPPARAEELRKRREREAVEDAAAGETIAHLMDPRHKEIFDWLCQVQGGKRAAQLLKEILRSAMIRERVAYREYKGGGGNSSRNLATLAERLPGKS